MTPRHPSTAVHPFPPRAYAIYVVAVLLVVTLLSLLDRQLPALLVKPIKQSFAISDTQFSLLQGSAFAIFYTVMGIPFGRLVDHTNRRNLIIFGLILWSAMTVYAGLADSYGQFFASRVGVGVGEACLAPAAYSIIADYFPLHQRARAISTYYVSLAFGVGASLIIGGLILPRLPPSGIALPLVGTLPPWKLMFILVGLPGLALAPLLLTVAEPIRREASSVITTAMRSSMGDVLRHVAQHKTAFLCVLASASATGIAGYATLAWAPAFYERRFGIGVSVSGPVLGTLVGVAGLAGTLLSGVLSDRWTRKRVPAARFRVAAFAWVIMLPTYIAWPLVANVMLSFALLAVAILAGNISQSSSPVVIQEIVPNRMRGQVIAGYLLIAGLLALGLGPTAPALLADHLTRGENALGHALALVGLLTGLVGPLAAWLGLRPYERSWVNIVGASSDSHVDLTRSPTEAA